MRNASHTYRGVVFLNALILLGIMSFVPTMVSLTAPENTFFDKRVVIESGHSLKDIANQLEREGVITNATIFRAVLILSGKAREVKSGTYIFQRPKSLLHTAYKVTNGIFGTPPIRVVVFEGDTVGDIAIRFSKYLDNFNAEKFVSTSKGFEGYLFPDTYVFFPSDDDQVVFNLMRKTFDEKVGTSTPRDIITMASIIEREAPSNIRDKRLISGILWKRIEDGMPLQVDAPFYYSIGKGSLQLTLDDLQSDSPYNTYRNLGLPPTPISNPGLSAIQAAQDPLDSNYWFFLSDRWGNMHYAVTFDQHKSNKARYLR